MKKVRMALLLLLLLLSTINYYQISNLFDLNNQELDEEKQLNNRKIPILASNSTVIAERIRNHNQATEQHRMGEQNLENPNNNMTMYSGIRLPSYKITARGPIDIDNNTAFGPSGYNFTGLGTESDPYIIEGYNITTNAQILIDIRDTSVYFIIRDNILNGITGSYTSIYLWNVTHGLIYNNTLRFGYVGIVFNSNSYNNTISNNIIENNSFIGVLISASSNNTVSGNNVSYNQMTGIYMNGSSFNTLTGNSLGYNFNGISVSFTSNNSISKNKIFNSTQFGCMLGGGADNSTFSRNNIYNNSFLGLFIDQSKSTFVDRNNFINNYPSGIGKSQAQDNGSSNVFIYNYWNEWTSPDSNSNGYVDDVYWVNGTAGNSDSFPLVSPFVGYIPHVPIYIDDNTDFETLGFPGSGIEGDPYIIEGYSITNNTMKLIEIIDTTVYFKIKDCLLNGINNSYDGIRFSNVGNGTIENITLYNCISGLFIQSSQNTNVSGSYFFNNSLIGIYFWSSSHCDFMNNNVSDNNVGIEIDYCTNITVSINFVHDNGYGMSLFYATTTDNIISNNTVFNNNNAGFYLGDYIDNNNITENMIFNNSKGIILQKVSNNTISNNEIFDNTDDGILIWTGSNNNRFIDNQIFNNTDAGIRFYNGSYNIFRENSFYNNTGYGIDLDTLSENNTVKWNHFFGNNQGSTQASDGGSNNNFAYNYWDDHPGADSEPDGIFDTPYNIIGGNIDPSPLAYPLLPHSPIYIDKEADFATLGFSGQGTINDPYMIEEYFIINSTTTLIHIQDTTAYFIIRYNNLNCIDMSGIGIYLQNVTNGYIHNNSIQNGTYGIKLVMSDNNNLTYNNVFNCGSPLDSGGIVIQEGSDYNILKWNEVYNCTTPDTYSISLHTSDYNLLENNQIYKGRNGIKLYLSDLNNVSYNIIDEILGTGNSIGLWGRESNNNTFSYNIITDNNYEPCYLQDCDYNILEGNIIANNSRSGIDLHSNSIYNQIRNNTIYNQVQQAAVRLRDYSSNNLIIDNMFYQNNWGILCGWGGGQGGCNNNDIINNTIIDNTDYGIQMEKASYNMIVNNTISNNALAGIYFVSSSGYNTIYSNNIFNNIGGQTIDDNGTNEFQKNGWGNYWGMAYTGSDNNGDNFGDTPYSFPGNQDTYPLIYPIEWYLSLNTSVIEGDWIVIGPEYHENEFITLSGNLNISSTGNLTLHNVILRFNCSFDGQYHIEVNGGNLTIEATSTVTTLNITNAWYLQAYSGSNLLLKDSIFSYAGYDYQDLSGLWISTNGAQVLNCSIHNNFIGLYLNKTNDVLIKDNNINNIYAFGIHISESNNNIILSNLIANNNQGIAMGPYCNNNNITGNIIYNSSDNGISIAGLSKNNNISSNIIYDSTNAGLWVVNSDNNTLFNNTLFNNNPGILLDSSSNNILYNNDIYSNFRGIELDIGSGYNHIYLNNIIDNSESALDQNGTNIFYRIGLGNHWGSAYSGSDTNGDGVGDTPFSFTGNQDLFPLIYVAEWYTFIEGNWNVTNTETYQNKIIKLTGNLIISPTGDLTLHNVNLLMNCGFDGQYHIEVNGGNLTIEATSTVTTLNVPNAWYLQAYSGSNLLLVNSTFSYAGYEYQDLSGLWISTNGAQVLNCSIHNNFIGLYLNKTNDVLIKDNTIKNNYAFGIQISESNNNIILSNLIANNNQGIAMGPYCNNNNITGNIIYDNSDIGVAITGLSNNNYISSNIIYNSTNIGFWLTSSDNNTLFNNTVYNNNGQGIVLENADYNNVSENQVYGNINGIRLESTSIKNTVSNNTISNNFNYGIMTGPLTVNNTIKWNDFIDNNPTPTEAQALDDGTDNTFDYNYWSEWTSPDDDLDGIVDTPYAIDGSATSFDLFPLTTRISEPLSVTIESPQDQVYFTDTITVFLSGNADIFWYYIEDFDTDNQTYSDIVYRTLPDGFYTLHAYGNDSTGNIEFDSVSFRINSNPPDVMVISPNGNETIEGNTRISWTVNDTEGLPHTFFVYYWNGKSWVYLENTTRNSYSWDTTTVPDRSDYKILVNASDGFLIGTDESNGTFTIDNDPTFQIIPAGYTEFTVRDHDITVGINVDETVNVTIQTQVSNPPSTPTELESLEIYLDITLSDPDALEYLWINVSFDELNGHDPTNVRIYYYDERLDRWESVKETGVDFDNEVVWGRSEHVTLFGVMDEQTQPADDWLMLLLIALVLITPVIVATVFIYRRAKKRMRMKRAKEEIRKSQIDLGILTRDLNKD